MDLAWEAPGRSADRLNQTLLAPQEPFLVRIEDGDQRHLWKVQTLAEQVDADKHVELSGPQLPQQLDPLQGVHLGVQISGTDAVLKEIVGEVLRHLLGERGHQNALTPIRPQPNLTHQIVDLAMSGLDDDLRVDSPVGRISCSTNPDDLASS